MSMEEYHAHPAMSASRLKAAITGTPLDYWAKHVDPDRVTPEPSDAMRQGSLVDCLLTEPAEFVRRYAVLPDDAPKRPTSSQRNAAKPSAATLDAIAWWDDWALRHEGMEVISAEWHDTAHAIAARLRSDERIAPLLTGLGTSQQPHFWTDAKGRECRYKPDLELPAKGVLLDLKKTMSARPIMFRSQAWRLGYDIQLAHYSEGFESRHGRPVERAGFICFEWKAPFNYSLLWVDEEFLAQGAQRREDAFGLIAECQASDVWPSYGEATISIPGWAEVDSAADDLDLEEVLEWT